VILAVGDDGLGEVKELDEFFCGAHVFERARVVFGGKKVIAIVEAQSFDNVFESVGVGPADADGFFGESECLLLLIVKLLFGEDPGELVWEEIGGEEGFGVDGDERVDGGHKKIFDFGFWIQKRDFRSGTPVGIVLKTTKQKL